MENATDKLVCNLARILNVTRKKSSINHNSDKTSSSFIVSEKSRKSSLNKILEISRTKSLVKHEEKNLELNLSNHEDQEVIDFNYNNNLIKNIIKR